jgi:hypothetical protein
MNNEFAIISKLLGTQTSALEVPSVEALNDDEMGLAAGGGGMENLN